MRVRNAIKSIARTFPILATRADHVLFSLLQERSRGQVEKECEEVAEKIAKNGYCVIADFMPADICAQVIEDYKKISKNNPEYIQKFSDDRIYAMEEVSEAANQFYSNGFVKKVSDYYCETTTFNAFTMFNKVATRPGSLGSGEGWHKDLSFRQFKSFLYLADVGEDDAPFQLISNSHSLDNYIDDMRVGKLQFRELRISEEQIDNILSRDLSRLRTFTGKAGTLIMADTSSIHRGKPPTGGTRYALTNYYVEHSQITEDFICAYKPINPERIRALRSSATGLKQ